MRDPQLGALAAKLELVDDPELDKLYPVHFAGWVAAEVDGDWMRVDILDPSESVARPIDAPGITEKFRRIIRSCRATVFAAVAMSIEQQSVRELIDLLGAAGAARAAA